MGKTTSAAFPCGLQIHPEKELGEIFVEGPGCAILDQSKTIFSLECPLQKKNKWEIGEIFSGRDSLKWRRAMRVRGSYTHNTACQLTIAKSANKSQEGVWKGGGRTKADLNRRGFVGLLTGCAAAYIKKPAASGDCFHCGSVSSFIPKQLQFIFLSGFGASFWVGLVGKTKCLFHIEQR